MHINRVTILLACAGALIALPLASMTKPAFADGASWRANKLQQLERQAAAAQSSRPADNPAIIGGTDAPAGKWPFQVALLRTGYGSNYNAEWCGGALVDSFHVITAAHCVHGLNASKLRVLTGTQSLASGGTRHDIASITAHPNYNDRTTDYDIAVIALKTPATEIAFYASLLTQAQEKTLAKTGTKAYVLGWGSTKPNGGGYPKTLKQVSVPLVSRSNCNDGNSYDGDITARMICAGYTEGGKDACDGDSGGPLIVKDSHGRWRLQAGVVSWGDGCGERNLYGVYSRLAVLSAWAKTVIASQRPQMARNDCERLTGQGRALCRQNLARRK